MRLIYTYTAKRVITGILMAFVIVASIIMLVDFVEASRNLGRGETLSAGQLFILTALKAPKLIEQTIPFIVLFGVMGALNSLNRRSELIVMRASGLSAWRFLSPAIMIAALVGVFWTAVFNPLSSQTMEIHESLTNRFLGLETVTTEKRDIWLREGTPYKRTIIYAPRYDLLTRTLYDAEFTQFLPDENDNLVFNSRFDALEAKLLPNKYWQLTDVVENTEGLAKRHVQVLTLPTTITSQQLQYSQSPEKLPSFWTLPSQIEKLSQAGFSTAALQLQFTKLLALPLTLIAMTVIAAAVSMRLTREGGTIRLLLLGTTIGFTVFFMQNLLQAFGGAGVIPISIAVWSIPILVLLLSLAYLSWIEDG